MGWSLLPPSPTLPRQAILPSFSLAFLRVKQGETHQVVICRHIGFHSIPFDSIGFHWMPTAVNKGFLQMFPKVTKVDSTCHDDWLDHVLCMSANSPWLGGKWFSSTHFAGWRGGLSGTCWGKTPSFHLTSTSSRDFYSIMSWMRLNMKPNMQISQLDKKTLPSSGCFLTARQSTYNGVNPAIHLPKKIHPTRFPILQTTTKNLRQTEIIKPHKTSIKPPLN